ncbi:hypothetical protein MUK42_28588 [Musa troglodytarum]|uniref:Uncharacterized protein n=1 Tax=Musa troglodytarum TaxID=320322 RepID=A0A9E7G4U7_9LILI|nr:hypothetical protein MUK42_28588 [Musa troglodytarum]
MTSFGGGKTSFLFLRKGGAYDFTLSEEYRRIGTSRSLLPNLSLQPRHAKRLELHHARQAGLPTTPTSPMGSLSGLRTTGPLAPAGRRGDSGGDSRLLRWERFGDSERDNRSVEDEL